MGLTILPRGLAVFANGCRYLTSQGQLIEKYCDECFRLQGQTCALEPYARELAHASRTSVLDSASVH